MGPMLRAAPAGAPTTSQRRFCPSCLTWSDAFRPDGRGHPDRACPVCRSLERHRFLALLLPALVGPDGTGTTLDVAPTAATTPLVDGLTARRVGMDFDPRADGRTVNVQASLTQVPLADGAVDLVLCSHVLEHVPDDRAAMREIARVLAPTGLAVVAVPRRRGRPTDEDPSASAAERVLRFGQADHVRYYGEDFGDRLTASGLRYDEVTPGGLLPAAVVRTCAFMVNETFWLVRRADAPPATPGAESRLGADLVSGLMTRLARADTRRVEGDLAPATPYRDLLSLARRRLGPPTRSARRRVLGSVRAARSRRRPG